MSLFRRCRMLSRFPRVAILVVGIGAVVGLPAAAAPTGTTTPAQLVLSTNTDVVAVAPTGTVAGTPGAMALTTGEYAVKAKQITRAGLVFAATAVYAGAPPPRPARRPRRRPRS